LQRLFDRAERIRVLMRRSGAVGDDGEGEVVLTHIRSFADWCERRGGGGVRQFELPAAESFKYFGIYATGCGVVESSEDDVEAVGKIGFRDRERRADLEYVVADHV